MRAHYLQHVPFEGLGSIEPWLREQKYEITHTRFYESALLKEMGHSAAEACEQPDKDSLIFIAGDSSFLS